MTREVQTLREYLVAHVDSITLSLVPSTCDCLRSICDAPFLLRALTKVIYGEASFIAETRTESFRQDVIRRLDRAEESSISTTDSSVWECSHDIFYFRPWT